jgi:diguanylate cyclase
MLVIWVVLASAPFFSLRVTMAHAVFAVAAYGVAVVATPGPAQLVGLKLTMAAGTLVVGSLVIGGLAAQLRDLVGRLADAANTDPLTGLLNRRALDEGFDVELARSRRTRSALTLVMIDLDHFKEFNDRRGHPAGDTVLQRLAGVLNDTTRTADVVSRIGGEEFAVLAPETGVPGGLALAERLRRAIEVEFSSETPTLTASLGVAGSPAHGSDRMQLMKLADKALYKAKEAGRNRAVVSEIEPDPPKPERRVGDLVG